MEVHTCLGNDVDAFDFSDADLDPIRHAFPDARIVRHVDENDFLARAEHADILLTWNFDAAWYDRCPRLKIILTPAAGKDWIAPDPAGRVDIVHGRFHGDILAESLLGAILYLNHAGPRMVENFRKREWNRNLQTRTRLLRSQQVLIIGFGRIGEACGQLIASLGAEVIGVRRTPINQKGEIPVYELDRLDDLLSTADHVVLLLPGDSTTDGLMSERRIRRCKPGVMLYNFGRGNAMTTDDLMSTRQHIGGAWLDVTDEEPLPRSSSLWTLDNIMITPHSSCVYQEYRQYFVAEVVAELKDRFS